jgi:hypothetical protein
MKASDERMPQPNAKSAGSTTDKELGDAVAPGRCLATAGDLLADLANRCPTCLVEMNWIHSHYQCPRCGWRDSCCM